MSRFIRNRLALAAAVVLLLIVSLSVLAPVLIDRDRVLEQARRETFASPSGSVWFGRDELGRDAFARAVYGSRVSLTV